MRHVGWFLGAAILFAVGWGGIASAQDIPGDYIVVLHDDGTEPLDVASAHGLSATHRYSAVFKGFAAHVPPQALKGLQRNPRVASVQPDRVVYAIAQTVPTGVARIGAYPSASALPIDAGVAVIDTGINLSHPDLNVAYGVDCQRLNKRTKDCYVGGNDDNGHGSHVAGIIAAKDDGVGVVGVAPGARLFAVKVLNSNGSGTLSGVIQGIDWVTRNASARGVSVANLSLGGGGSDDTDGDPNGCLITANAEHKAYCSLVAAGVTVVVAAGNESDDAANHTPAAYDELITVSALADFDGASGGLGSATYNFSSCSESVDDSFACFSNYGHDVDLMAPGVGIYSTYMNGGYASMSGTSMAAPHVAGAAALIVAASPATLTPQEVKAALLAGGDPAPCAAAGGVCQDDPDGVQESLLLVAPPAPPCMQDEDCGDGVFCNGQESCVSGSCLPGIAPCDDGINCTEDTCQEATAECLNLPADSLCDDHNVCTDDACVPGLGCGNAANAAACDDGDPCTQADFCSNKTCVAGAEILFCIDADACCPAGCSDADDSDCAPSVVCGDGVCAGDEAGESCNTCSVDCACIGKNCKNGCCGNGSCEKSETASGCPADCL
ncbi:MAG: hypothetical protein C4523_04845 [Myxococcales bacterium]|nr:MAG: hypothetical protein C4523_04845 [Myxococcales bacterium]